MGRISVFTWPLLTLLTGRGAKLFGALNIHCHRSGSTENSSAFSCGTFIFKQLPLLAGFTANTHAEKGFAMLAVPHCNFFSPLLVAERRFLLTNCLFVPQLCRQKEAVQGLW